MRVMATLRMSGSLIELRSFTNFRGTGLMVRAVFLLVEDQIWRMSDLIYFEEIAV